MTVDGDAGRVLLSEDAVDEPAVRPRTRRGLVLAGAGSAVAVGAWWLRRRRR